MRVRSCMGIVNWPTPVPKVCVIVSDSPIQSPYFACTSLVRPSATVGYPRRATRTAWSLYNSTRRPLSCSRNKRPLLRRFKTWWTLPRCRWWWMAWDHCRMIGRCDLVYGAPWNVAAVPWVPIEWDICWLVDGVSSYWLGSPQASIHVLWSPPSAEALASDVQVH